MPLSIGVNLRVTGHCNQGGRKYMEDMFSVAYQQTPDDKDLEYAFFGIFDGHGGGEAATFAKEHLMDIIVKQKNFWSNRDEDVLRAIRDGYVNTHYAMWRELDKWPRTASGLPSTAGTTASIAFIRKGKIYIGHVGDSGIILGHQPDGEPQWRAKALTKDHKPESGPEMIRIQESGGKVVNKSGVPRVVWNRPRIGHKGPVRRSTHIDEIPFLAVARSLGDLWSYNSELNTFIVSPEPDVKVVAVDVKSYRCLIFGTDGLWNMLTPQAAVAIVQAAEMHNEKHIIASQQTGSGTDTQMWINPSKSLVDRALERWSSTRLRADNTSVVTVMLDPPGPSRNEVLLSQKREQVHSTKPVLYHIDHSLDATVLAEHCGTEQKLPEMVPLPMTTNVPSLILNPADSKQPDSSNEINDCVPTKEDETASIASPLTDSVDIENSSKVVLNNDIEEKTTTEGIQVAEVSSSEILEETTDVQCKETTNIIEKITYEDKRLEMTKCEKHEEGANVQTIVQKTAKKDCSDTSSESKLYNAIRENEFPSKCEELKATTSAPIVSVTDSSPGGAPLVNRLRRTSNIVSRSVTTLKDIEVKTTFLSCTTRHKQNNLVVNPKEDVKSTKQRHSLSSQSQPQTYPDAVSGDSKTYVTMNSRFKSRSARTVGHTEETARNSLCRTIGTKRRHSTMSQSASTTLEETSCGSQESCIKRRTRSEDRTVLPTDENNPSNQALEESNSRLSWPTTDSSSLNRSTDNSSGASVVQEKLSSSANTFQRRSLGKKATPMKSIRRPSFNGSSRLQQLRGSFGLRDWEQGRTDKSNTCGSDRNRISRSVGIIGSTDSSVPQRWLRSDTMAATPVKTLRSRNVDIAGHTISAQLVHQYGVVKQNRLSLPAKLKQSNGNGILQSSRMRSSSLSSNKHKQTGNSGANASTTCSTPSTGSSSSAGIAKRVKSHYNPSARSLSTRSRIKRLGK